MSEQDGTQKTKLQYPVTNDKEAWIVYWKAQSQPWRTEPEIETKRQKELAQRRAVIPDIKKGIYLFRDMKLSRADVEWLLATHENGRGPVDWNDESQRKRQGLDLRGADLSQEDLHGLPLACMRGGLTWEEWLSVTKEQKNTVAVRMQEAVLGGAQLQGANFRGAQLQGASLGGAQLQEANLREAQLQEADLWRVQLQEANLREAQLQGASLVGVQLQGAYLVGAQLQGAYLREVQLQGANLVGAQLQGAYLGGAELDSVHLNDATLSDETHGTVLLADIRWGEINLAVVDWTPVKMLGDEQVAQQEKNSQGRIKDKRTRVDEYKEAVRAYRQLSVVLRNQGLNEDAARFAYRAQLLQRRVFRLQGGIQSFGQYLSSLLLDLLAGYGYKPWRSFLAYLLVITTFAIAYFIIGHEFGPVLSPLGAFVFSMTSFHGRGFFPGGIGLDDPLTVLAALEAFVGLLIEVTFIATLTQRLFGK